VKGLSEEEARRRLSEVLLVATTDSMAKSLSSGSAKCSI
jgi:hypothetical protein